MLFFVGMETAMLRSISRKLAGTSGTMSGESLDNFTLTGLRGHTTLYHVFDDVFAWVHMFGLLLGHALGWYHCIVTRKAQKRQLVAGVTAHSVPSANIKVMRGGAHDDERNVVGGGGSGGVSGFDRIMSAWVQPVRQ